MRAGGKRRKYTFVFDSREMVFLVVGIVLIVSFSFLLGMVIGRNRAGVELSEKLAEVMESAASQAKESVRQEEESPVPEPEKTAALEVKEEELTFYSTLPDSDSEKPSEERAVTGKEVPEKKMAEEVAAPAKGRTHPKMRLEEGPYTVQVSSFKDKKQASALSKRLEEKGYPAYVVSTYLDEKGFWFRVRVGSFKNKGEAEKAVKVIRGEENLPAMVVLRSD